jgi:hypothetical protein
MLSGGPKSQRYREPVGIVELSAEVNFACRHRYGTDGHQGEVADASANRPLRSEISASFWFTGSVEEFIGMSFCEPLMFGFVCTDDILPSELR